MRNGKRWVAVGVTAALAALGLEFIAPAPASATSVELSCQGITGDSASSLGDSKATLELLSKLSPGSGSGLTFPVDITTNAPTRTTPNKDGFNADFDIALTLPDSVVTPAKTLLKLSTVKVTNATFAITASGAADAELTTSVPSLTVDLGQTPVVVRQRISGHIVPKSSGTIIYTASTNTKMTIEIGAEVQGIKINALTVTCSSNKPGGTTAVQIPGSPNVQQPMYQVAWAGTVVGLPLVGNTITPDDGNPVQTDTLKLTSQAPNGGYGATGGGAAFFLAPNQTGFYQPQYNVCAPSRTVPTVPGVNAVQSLTWPENYVGRDLNVHPLGMSLRFKGETTPVIPLSFDLANNPTPAEPQLLEALTSHFVAPSAATIQAALEKLPTIGAGNVQVTAAAKGGYTITFVGQLGLSDQPKVEIVNYTSWLPADGLAKIMAVLTPAPPAPGPGPTTTTTTIPDRTPDELNQLLLAGKITFEEWGAGQLNYIKNQIIKGATTPEALKALTAMFPKPPEVAETTPGKATIPQTETGPLCTAFTMGYLVIPNPFATLSAVQGKVVVRKCSYVRVKSKGRTIKKRVCKSVTVKR